MSAHSPKRNREEDGDGSNNEEDDAGDDQDGGADYDDMETGDESNAPDGNASAADLSQLDDKRQERSNAKAVECLDLDGNLIEVFRSGSLASAKLNIPQGEISLCCRGMKSSFMGYKFRFSGESEERQAMKIKKGFAIDYGFDNPVKIEQVRTTRASRGEYGQGVRYQDLGKRSILDPPELKARKWNLEKVRAGPLLISKWLPNASEPTAALQERIPKNATEARLKLSKRRRTLNRLSIGAPAQHKSAYEETG